MKKSAGGAQLGKVTKFMKNKYGLDDFSTIFDSMLTPEDLNEGIVDVIKIGIKFAINLFNLIFPSLVDFFAFCLVRNDDLAFGFLLKPLLEPPSFFILKIFAKILKKH